MGLDHVRRNMKTRINGEKRNQLTRMRFMEPKETAVNYLAPNHQIYWGQL